MTESELLEVMRRAWQEMPPSGHLSEEDNKKLRRVIEAIIPYLPEDSRTPPNTGPDHE